MENAAQSSHHREPAGSGQIIAIMTTIQTPFGAKTTASEVVAGVRCPGQRMIVTGAASGLGLETARALARTGAEITLAVRAVESGRNAAREIIASTGNPKIHVATLDLADRASVNAFARGWQGPLHVLINNAGMMGGPELRTSAGW